MQLLLLLFCAYFAIGTLATAADRPTDITYFCVIPEGLEKVITLHPKDGEPMQRDAHSIYRERHAIGWFALMQHYAKSGTYFYEVVATSSFGIERLSFEIGRSEARTTILKGELEHGKEMFRRLVSAHLEKQRNTGSELDAGE